MDPNETNGALNQTVSQLRGGVLRVGIASAIPLIASWERTLEATGLPELAPLAENLKTLRTTLSSDDAQPAGVGRPLNVLGDQVGAVAAPPAVSAHRGPPGAIELAAERRGATLAGQART